MSQGNAKNTSVVVTASLAGLLFGFDTVVISGVTESVGKVFELERGGFWYGFAVASALLGTLIGALVAGIPGDRYGSRDTLAILLAVFNQLSGINGILYYLNDTLKAAGIEGMSNAWQSVAIGAANFVATLLALRVIDKVGRRKLLLIGSVGTAVALAAAAAIFATGSGGRYFTAVLIVFISFFAFSQGAVIWVYLAEIFPTAVRSRGQALGSATHWAMAAVISQTYPMLQASSLALPFAIFAGCMVLQFFVVFALFPETRGVELESMDQALERKAGVS
jgi:MFS family permease